MVATASPRSGPLPRSPSQLFGWACAFPRLTSECSEARPRSFMVDLRSPGTHLSSSSATSEVQGAGEFVLPAASEPFGCFRSTADVLNRARALPRSISEPAEVRRCSSLVDLGSSEMPPRSSAIGTLGSFDARRHLVVDSVRAFVSTADSTQRGHERNIEVKVLIEDPTFANRLAGQWIELVERRVRCGIQCG